jgi:pilus biogenesis lipoprotein CpaD
MLASMTLSACAQGTAELDASAGWLTATSPKRLEIDRAQYRHTIYFATDRANIIGSEQDRLLSFLDTVGPLKTDSIRLDGHADERATDLYNLDLAARRIESVKRFLGDHGVNEHNIQANSLGERAPAAHGDEELSWQKNRRVEIVLERYLVTTPACPDWSRRSGLDYANQPHSNFGCATETNLGLMIAEPRDLLRGRDLDPADGVHQAEGIVRYREGEQPELQEERVN